MEPTRDSNGRITDIATRLRSGRLARGARARRGLGRGSLSLVLLALVPVALAACGGSHSPGVARLGTTTTSTASASSGSLDQFAACMRSHGVPNFPNPTNNGTSLKIPGGSGINPGSPQFNSAQAACSGFLPPGSKGGGPTITPADRLDYLKAVACVRAHGVPDFPEPTFVDGQVSFHIPSTLSRTSPVVAKAIETCRKLIPAGLPYSGTDGG